jgi:hypothetical protein
MIQPILPPIQVLLWRTVVKTSRGNRGLVP